jgi:hypothetical protein
MKMVMIICPDNRREDVHKVLHQHGVQGFSEMAGSWRSVSSVILRKELVLGKALE